MAKQTCKHCGGVIEDDNNKTGYCRPLCASQAKKVKKKRRL